MGVAMSSQVVVEEVEMTEEDQDMLAEQEVRNDEDSDQHSEEVSLHMRYIPYNYKYHVFLCRP